MGSMADFLHIAPMLEVRVDMNQERPTTLTLSHTSEGHTPESEPFVHVHLSVGLDGTQVRALIDALEKGVGGTWGK